MLVEMWRAKGVNEAYEILSKPDVTVTNQQDKEVVLQKIKKINEQVRSVMGAGGPRDDRRSAALLCVTC